MGRGRTCVSSGILLPSKVTHLVIRRPPNFEFCPGDYVFVRIPRIAKYEWHPFTISSAPEHSGKSRNHEMSGFNLQIPYQFRRHLAPHPCRRRVDDETVRLF